MMLQRPLGKQRFYNRSFGKAVVRFFEVLSDSESERTVLMSERSVEMVKSAEVQRSFAHICPVWPSLPALNTLRVERVWHY